MIKKTSLWFARKNRKGLKLTKLRQRELERGFAMVEYYDSKFGSQEWTTEWARGDILLRDDRRWGVAPYFIAINNPGFAYIVFARAHDMGCQASDMSPVVEKMDNLNFTWKQAIIGLLEDPARNLAS